MAEVRRGGKKGRKHGRNKRKPSSMRYKSTDRLTRNRAKRVARYKLNMAKAATARAHRVVPIAPVIGAGAIAA